MVWMPSPVGHSTGFNYGVRFALHHGLRLVLQDRWDGEAAARLVDRERCSYTLAATTFLQDLCEAAGRLGLRLDSLRAFGCGGAPVPPPLVDLAGEHGVTVLRLYGSTEVLVATWNRAGDDAARRRGTDGRAMSHVEVEVRRADAGLPPTSRPHPGPGPGSRSVPASRARSSCGAPTPASASSPTPSGRPPPSPTVGSAAATWRRSTRPATSRSWGAARRSSSGAD